MNKDNVYNATSVISALRHSPSSPENVCLCKVRLHALLGECLPTFSGTVFREGCLVSSLPHLGLHSWAGGRPFAVLA